MVAISEAGADGATPETHLVDGRWRVFQLERGKNEFSFIAQGFGRGAMTWFVDRDGWYEVRVDSATETKRTRVASEGNVLRIDAGGDY